MENIDEHSLEFAQTLKTEEDFQNFVDTHPEIERSIDLRKKYYHIDRRFYNLKRDGILDKDFSIKYKIMLFDWSDYNTKEDFQRFIDENNIESSSVIYEKFGGLAKRASRLKIKLYELKYHIENLSNIIEDANKFIKENNIISFKHLEMSYPNKAKEFLVVKKYIDFKIKKDSQWNDYTTAEKVQDFIDSHDIKSRTKFKKSYPGFFNQCVKLDILNLLTFEEDKHFIKYKIKERFKTIEDVYKFLDENGISKSSQLDSTEEGRSIHWFARTNGWKIEFSGKPKDWSDYNTENDFQKFIDENDIRSASEFHEKFTGMYSRLSRLKLNKKVKYPESPGKSTLEIRVSKELDKLGIVYLEQETFPDLKDKSLLKVDFLIESKKLILEPGGEQHLVPCGLVMGERFETLQKHDEMKRKYFKEKGYTILYLFSNSRKDISDKEFKRLVKEYPGECYTLDNFDSFINRILSF